MQSLELRDAEFAKALQASIQDLNVVMIQRVKDCNAAGITKWNRELWVKAHHADLENKDYRMGRLDIKTVQRGIAQFTIFQKADIKIVESFLHDEGSTLLGNVVKADARFRRGLSNEVVEDPVRLAVVVELRDKRRAVNITKWRSEKEEDFLDMLEFITSRNAKTFG